MKILEDFFFYKGHNSACIVSSITFTAAINSRRESYSTIKISQNRRKKKHQKVLNRENAIRIIGEESVTTISKTWTEMEGKGSGQANYHQANGIIRSLIDQGLKNRAIKGILVEVDNGRIDRIRKDPIQKP